MSGPVKELFAGFNQDVKKGELLARIDPRIYEATVAQNQANVAQSQATLVNHEAEVLRAKALLQQAVNNERRAMLLRQEDETFVAEQEMDSLKFNRERWRPKSEWRKRRSNSQAAVEQAKAILKYVQTQLEYTNIYSPVDGIIINRKIDPGQTLAAQFQTPELFVVAPDMERRCTSTLSVDEADIGLIREAKQKNRSRSSSPSMPT